MISNLGINCNCLNSILNCQPWSLIVYTSKPKSHRPISTVLPTASKGKIAACLLTFFIWLSTKLTAESSNRRQFRNTTTHHLQLSFSVNSKKSLPFQILYHFAKKQEKKKKEEVQFLSLILTLKTTPQIYGEA